MFTFTKLQRNSGNIDGGIKWIRYLTTTTQNNINNDIREDISGIWDGRINIEIDSSIHDTMVVHIPNILDSGRPLVVLITTGITADDRYKIDSYFRKLIKNDIVDMGVVLPDPALSKNVRNGSTIISFKDLDPTYNHWDGISIKEFAEAPLFYRYFLYGVYYSYCDIITKEVLVEMMESGSKYKYTIPLNIITNNKSVTNRAIINAYGDKIKMFDETFNYLLLGYYDNTGKEFPDVICDIWNVVHALKMNGTKKFSRFSDKFYIHYVAIIYFMDERIGIMPVGKRENQPPFFNYYKDILSMMMVMGYIDKGIVLNKSVYMSGNLIKIVSHKPSYNDMRVVMYNDHNNIVYHDHYAFNKDNGNVIRYIIRQFMKGFITLSEGKRNFYNPTKADTLFITSFFTGSSDLVTYIPKWGVVNDRFNNLYLSKKMNQIHSSFTLTSSSSSRDDVEDILRYSLSFTLIEFIDVTNALGTDVYEIARQSIYTHEDKDKDIWIRKYGTESQYTSTLGSVMIDNKKINTKVHTSDIADVIYNICMDYIKDDSSSQRYRMRIKIADTGIKYDIVPVNENGKCIVRFYRV